MNSKISDTVSVRFNRFILLCIYFSVHCFPRFGITQQYNFKGNESFVVLLIHVCINKIRVITKIIFICLNQLFR